MNNPLPTPHLAAIEQSKQLVKHILRAITTNGGAIGFDEYMDYALYTPQLGYYRNAGQKFGIDFTTATELSPVFARCLAKQCQQILSEIGGDLLEIGPGSGQLAVDLYFSINR